MSAQETTYTFISVPFNSFEGFAGCPPICRLSGSFTIQNPLPANLISKFGIGGSGDFVPLAFTFTDGVHTITNNDATYTLGDNVGFSFETDSDGDISQFSFYAESQDFYIAVYNSDANGPGGANTVYASSGIDSSQFEARAPTSTGAWTIRYSQADLPWGPTRYDDHPGTYMKGLGCGTTAMSMVFNLTGWSNGVYVNPGVLNDYMKLPNNGYTSVNAKTGRGHDVDWGIFSTSAIGATSFNPNHKSLRWHDLRSGGTPTQSTSQILASMLDDAHNTGYVIVAVPGVIGTTSPCTLRRPAPTDHTPFHHFVLVTGKMLHSDGTYTFTINDPGCRTNNDLSFYTIVPFREPTFALIGYVDDPVDLSGMGYHGSQNVEITLLDPSGLKTGFAGTGDDNLYEIPDSSYVTTELTDDETGDVALGTDHYLGVTNPQQGGYTVVLTGVDSGLFDLLINVEADDGTTQSFSFSGVTNANTTTTYELQYSSMPGALPQPNLASGSSGTVPPTQVSTTASGLAYSRVTQTFNGTVTVTNISSSTISGPLQVVFTGMPMNSSLVNATGIFATFPYITLPAVNSLAPGQSITVDVQFRNPSNGTINLAPVIYSGSLSQ